MRTLFCIANKNARKFRKYPILLNKLQSHFPRSSAKLLVTDTLAEAKRAFLQIYEARPKVLVVCGGDGTLHHALNQLIPLYGNEPLPNIAIVPAGTMNVVFHSTSTNRHRKDLDFGSMFEELVSKQQGSACELPLLRCQDTYGFIFAVGGFANFVAWYRDHPDPSPWHALRLMVRLMVSTVFRRKSADDIFPSFRACVTIDERQQTQIFRTISVSAVSHIGLGFHPYPDAQTAQKKLGAFLLRGSAMSLPRYAMDFLRKKKPQTPAFQQLPALAVDISLQEKLVWMMDGEMFPAETSLTIRLGPTLRFV